MRKINLLFASLGKPEKEEDKQEEFVHMPKEQYEELMGLAKKLKDIDFEKLNQPAQQNQGLSTSDLAKFASDIVKGMANNAEQSTQMLIGRKVFGIQPIDIPEDDYMEVPAVFFMYNTCSMIFDDFRNGKAINAPLGPIKFAKAYKSVKKENNKFIYNNICSATVFSKMQAEFLRKHSKFQVTFFENLGDAMKTVTEIEISSLQQASDMLSGKSGHEIHRMALSYGIKIDTNDESELRRRVVKRYAKNIMENNSSVRRNIQKESTEGVALLEKKTE